MKRCFIMLHQPQQNENLSTEYKHKFIEQI